MEEIKLQHGSIWAEDKRGSVSRKMCFLKSAAVIFLLSFVVYFALDALANTENASRQQQRINQLRSGRDTSGNKTTTNKQQSEGMEV